MATLAKSDIPYALCGGLAVVLHGYPRATRDIDMLILPDDYERVRQAVAPLGFTLEATPMIFAADSPEERKILRITKLVDDEALILDLVLATGFLHEVWENRETYQIDEHEVVAVDREGLVKMKRASGRTQDLADLENLPTNETDH